MAHEAAFRSNIEPSCGDNKKQPVKYCKDLAGSDIHMVRLHAHTDRHMYAHICAKGSHSQHIYIFSVFPR